MNFDLHSISAKFVFQDRRPVNKKTDMKESGMDLENSGAPLLGIIMPCYNEAEGLRECASVVGGLLTRMARKGEISEKSFILFVDDGSSDDSWDVICSLHSSDDNIKGLRLASNRGQQMALLAGMEAVSGRCDAVITLDSDLQDDPEVIPEMVERFCNGHEIVYGVRGSRRSDGVFKKTSASLFYGFQRMLGLETIDQHADYRLLSSRALEMLLEYGERNLFLRGIVPGLGLDHSVVEYDRRSRYAGETKYPLKKMLSLALDGITSFSARPMRMIFFTGLFFLLLSVCVAVYVMLSYSSGHTVSGWTSLMLSVWFLGSLILMAVGIVGEYIGKIYMEVKRRPRYAVRDRLL